MPRNKAKAAEFMRAWRLKNRGKAREIDRACYYRNHEERKARLRIANRKDPEAHNVAHLRYHNQRMETDPDYARRHRLNNLLVQVNRLFGKRAISKFFAVEIKAFYAACPEGMEVDHIHPLKGETSTGLHVPWNLQYLTSSANKRKGRKLLEEEN